MRRSERVSRRRRHARPHPGIRVAFAAALILAIGGAAIALANTDDQHARTGADPAQAGHRSPSTGAGRQGSTDSTHREAWTTTNIYAHTRAGMFTPVTRRARYLIYVPDSRGSGVYVINPNTYKVIRYIQTGTMVQHVVPAWDLRTLYATNDTGNSLTPINPDNGKRAGPNIPVADPYNMYFTPARWRCRRRSTCTVPASTTWTSRPTATSHWQAASSRGRWSASTSGPRPLPDTSTSAEARRT
jgi:hypothetical protein